MAKSKRASAHNFSQSTKPRCKTGDIAIILRGPRAGYIVDVLEHHAKVVTWKGETVFDVWHIQHPTDEPNFRQCFVDKYLFPIRPGDLAEAETDEVSLVAGRLA